MMQLKATKASLYRLIARYEDMPKRNHTDYSKVPYTRSWFLRWRDDSMLCEVHFSTILGTACLSVERKDWDGQRVSRKVYHVPLEVLRELNMVEEWTRRGADKPAERQPV